MIDLNITDHDAKMAAAEDMAKGGNYTQAAAIMLEAVDEWELEWATRNPNPTGIVKAFHERRVRDLHAQVKQWSEQTAAQAEEA